jgi:hypothetical protein
MRVTRGMPRTCSTRRRRTRASPATDFVDDAGVCMPGCYAEACDGEDNDCDGVIDDGVFGFGAAQAFGDETTTVLAMLPLNATTHLVLFEGEPSPGDYSVQVTEIDAGGVRVLGKTRTVDPSSSIGAREASPCVQVRELRRVCLLAQRKRWPRRRVRAPPPARSSGATSAAMRRSTGPRQTPRNCGSSTTPRGASRSRASA